MTLVSPGRLLSYDDRTDVIISLLSLREEEHIL